MVRNPLHAQSLLVLLGMLVLASLAARAELVAATNQAHTLSPNTAVLAAPEFSTPEGALGNGTISFLLVSSTSAINTGEDLDKGDNAILEGLPGSATILDAVGWTEGNTNDIVHGGGVLMLPSGTPDAAKRVPVVYSTDLFHPHVDPDDHFDLACLYAMPEVDLRAIILDNSAPQTHKPGFKPVWQLNYLTGRHIPAALGLSQPLKSPEDPALDQPAEHQNGVNLLLQTLRDSGEKVVIMFVGSARDTVAAFNREPNLFRRKVRSIYGFIGDASDPSFIEYNVGLDPRAFVRLMRSELPFYWMPCFDGGAWKNKGHASYWKIRQREVLANAPEPLQRYFLYMLRQATNDPIAYLTLPTTAEDRQWMMEGERNLWCGALLGLSVGRPVVHAGHAVAGFSPVDVSVSGNGVVSYGKTPGSHRVMRFEIKDDANWVAAATAATEQLLAQFPIIRR